MSQKETISKLKMELSEAATTLQNTKSQAQADFKRMEQGFKAADAKMTKILREKDLQLKTVQSELQKSRTLLERLNELILWFEQNILDKDGNFPFKKITWKTILFNLGIFISMITKLAQWLPETIAIFKKK